MQEKEPDPIVKIRNDIRMALAHAAQVFPKVELGDDEYERYAVLTNRLIKDEITIDQFEDRLFEALARRDNPYAADVARRTTNEIGRILNRYRGGSPTGEIQKLKERLGEIEKRLNEVK